MICSPGGAGISKSLNVGVSLHKDAAFRFGYYQNPFGGDKKGGGLGGVHEHGMKGPSRNQLWRYDGWSV